jgi:hypothetical protein
MISIPLGFFRRHRRCHEVLVAKAIGEESAHGTAGDVESLALVAWKKWLCYGYAMAMLWLFWMGKNAIISSCLRKMVVENCGIPSVHRDPAMGGSKLAFQCLHWLFSGSSC